MDWNKPTCIPIEAARKDSRLLKQCTDLISRHYADSDRPLQYALNCESTHLYVSHNGKGLSAIFFARMPEKWCAGFPSVGDMGLTASLGDASGQARELWRTYLADARIAAGHAEVWAWYRTATPFGLYPCHCLLKYGEPQINGGLSDAGATMIREIRRHFRVPTEGLQDHPFVVRRWASSCYSDLSKGA